MDLASLYSPVIPPKDPAPLRPGARILALGSCFAAEGATFLGDRGFTVTPAPFGILYNPRSLARALHRVASGRPYGSEDLTPSGDGWVSFDHSGAFARPDPDAALEAMNGALSLAHRAAPELDALLLTLGTAFAYARRDTGETVASCHRAPRAEFLRRPLAVEDGTAALIAGVEALRARAPGLKVIVSVSPVRHLRDDPAENSLSKALCRLIAQGVVDALPGALYFPAFEIVLDELRDYRFFGPDRAHPTPEAVAHVMDRFSAAHLSSEALALCDALAPLLRGLDHRPRSPGSPEDRRFCAHLRRELEAVTARCPGADLSPLWARLRAREAAGG